MGAAVVDSVPISFHALDVFFWCYKLQTLYSQVPARTAILANSYVLQQQSCLTRKKAQWGGGLKFAQYNSHKILFYKPCTRVLLCIKTVYRAACHRTCDYRDRTDTRLVNSFALYGNSSIILH